MVPSPGDAAHLCKVAHDSADPSNDCSKARFEGCDSVAGILRAVAADADLSTRDVAAEAGAASERLGALYVITLPALVLRAARY